MKKLVFAPLALSLFAFALILSCKSAPPAPVDDSPDLVDYAGLNDVIAKAQDKRQEVVDAGLEMDNLSAVEQADAKLRNAEDAYDKGEKNLSKTDRNNAFKDAQGALLGYTGILDEHWINNASELRARSLAEQQEALKLKADIAVRDDYNLTTNIHNQGEAAYRNRDYRTAITHFTESIDLYSNVSAAAAEKRRIATLALQSAETKISESEKIAADAEAVLGEEGANDSAGKM